MTAQRALRAFLSLALCTSGAASAADGTSILNLKEASPKNSALEFKLGGYKPQIDSSFSDNGPYNSTFGASSMLLFETEYDRQLWQKFGSLGVGGSAGYAEKYAKAFSIDAAGNRVQSSENTALKVLPLRVLGVYRFDWAALQWGVPLVPYAKAGLVYELWWATKGDGVEFVNGERGAGGKWGYQFTGGISLMLDILEPRLARDFDVDLGVNHSYLFAEYTYANVNDFGSGGLDLSSRHWMFGLAVEY